MTTAVQLKAEGVRAGVSDLFLAYPIATGKVVMSDFRNFYSGLWIEMKGRGKYVHLTPTQFAWLTKMKSDYACCVAYGWEEARNYILEYVEGKWKDHEIRSSRPLKAGEEDGESTERASSRGTGEETRQD